MLLYALDSLNHVIFANHARKQQDYFCLECRSAVRMRGGLHRQNHFYHIQPNRTCRQSGKTPEHLQVQMFIQSLLPEGEAVIEQPFKEIHRIADVAWLSEKIIFEIQCSPISAQEVEQRNADYGSLGFQVIWILHERRYNQRKLTAAELFLRGRSHYFTTIDADGIGEIYDQYDVVQKGMRQSILQKFTLDVRGLKAVGHMHVAAAPKIVKQRVEKWPYCFSGDLIDRCLSGAAEEVESILEWERKAGKVTAFGVVDRIKDLLFYYLVRPYCLFFQILLERACR